MSSDDDVVIIDTSESERDARDEANVYSDSAAQENLSSRSSHLRVGDSDLVHSDFGRNKMAVVQVDAGVNTSVRVEEEMERRLNVNLVHLGEALSALKKPFFDPLETPPSAYLARREKLKDLKRSRIDAMAKQEPFSPEEPAFSVTKQEDEPPTWLQGLTDCLRRLEKTSETYFDQKDTSASAAPLFLLSPVEGSTLSPGGEKQREENELHDSEKQLRASHDKLKEKLRCAEAILRKEGADSLDTIYEELQALRQRSKEAARSTASDCARVLSEQDLVFHELIEIFSSKRTSYSRTFVGRCGEQGESVAALQQDLDRLTMFQRRVKEIAESMPSAAHSPHHPTVAAPRLAGRSAEIVYQTLEKERAHLKQENEKLTQQLFRAQHERQNLLAAFQLADEKEAQAKLSTLEQVIESCGEQRRRNVESVATSLGWEVEAVSADEVALRHSETKEVRSVSLVGEVRPKAPATFAELAALEVDLPPLPSSDSEDLQSIHSGEDTAHSAASRLPSHTSSAFHEAEERESGAEEKEEEKEEREERGEREEDRASVPLNTDTAAGEEDKPETTVQDMADLPSLPPSSSDDNDDTDENNKSFE